jgi:hypothetical protein
MNFLKQLFNRKDTVDNGIHTDYNQNLINQYKVKYPNISFEEFTIPKLKNETKFQIKKWHFNEGDQISSYQTICTLENSNSEMELESNINGVLFFKTAPGKNLNPGKIICLIIRFPKETNIEKLLAK